MVTEQEGWPSYVSAIAGLATDSDSDRGPNLIKTMRDSGIIRSATFSFYLHDYGNNSYLDIGHVDTDVMKDPENLFMVDILKYNYWWA